MEKKKIYHAPSADFLLLAPCEGLSTSQKFGKNNGWWGLENSAWWGTRPQNASVVTGTLNIDDEDGTSWELP